MEISKRLLIFIGLLQFGFVQSFVYPTIVMCSTDPIFPTLSQCGFRQDYEDSFSNCIGDKYNENLTVNLLGNNQSSKEYCVAVSVDWMEGTAFSILTIVSNGSENLIDHVFLVAAGDPIPSDIDEFVEVIWVYRASILITITACTTNNLDPNYITMFSTNIHTEFRPNPPQNLWIRFDPACSSCP